MEQARRVALVTSREESRLAEDDRLLVPELGRREIEASAQVWDDAGVKWNSFDAIVLRSTWDYHLRYEEFCRWIAEREAQGAALWNPAPLVRWNMHKFYLRDLREKGVSIVPTRFLAAGSAVLEKELAEAGWDRAVVKPAVSSTAFRTHLVDAASASRDGAARALLAESDVLLQKYMPEIETEGEVSFIHIAGKFSHAVRKRPSSGDFRVQEQYGGRADAEHPSEERVLQAGRIVAAIDSPWLYARVDAVESDGELMLMELELVEPTLYLTSGSGSVRRFADSIEKVVA